MVQLHKRWSRYAFWSQRAPLLSMSCHRFHDPKALSPRAPGSVREYRIGAAALRFGRYLPIQEGIAHCEIAKRRNDMKARWGDRL